MISNLVADFILLQAAEFFNRRVRRGNRERGEIFDRADATGFDIIIPQI
jgi:hypothetical protein